MAKRGFPVSFDPFVALDWWHAGPSLQPSSCLAKRNGAGPLYGDRDSRLQSVAVLIDFLRFLSLIEGVLGADCPMLGKSLAIMIRLKCVPHSIPPRSRSLVLKVALHTASVAIVFLLMAVPASAIQVSYTLLEEGGSGTLSGIAATQMDEYFDAQLGTYQFTGSIEPDRLGLIGVSSGFRAAVSRFVPGFSPEPGGGGYIAQRMLAAKDENHAPPHGSSRKGGKKEKAGNSKEDKNGKHEKEKNTAAPATVSAK